MPTNQVQTNWPLRKPQQLVYVELGPDNGGMVLGICEQGLSFRAVAPLRTEGPVYFTFALDGKTRLNGAGEIAWSEDSGKSGGLKFTNISQQFREALRAWLESEATPKTVGREVTPAAAPPLDSLSAPNPRTHSASVISVEEAKPAAAPAVPSETKPAAPKPVIPAPDTRSTPPAYIEPPAETKPVEPKPAEPKPRKAKPQEAKPVEHIQPEQLVREVEAQVPVPATPEKIETKIVEAKPDMPKPEPPKRESATPEQPKQESLKPIEALRPEPVVREPGTQPDLRTAAHLPAEEPHAEPIFSLPNFRLPSAEVVVPTLAEKSAEPKPFDEHGSYEAKPEPVAVEPPTPQTLPPALSAESSHELQHEIPHELTPRELQHALESEPRGLIPPPANPEPWELPEVQEASEETAEEPPRLNRAVAASIIGLALAVLLVALVISLHREIGEALIRLGETLSGEDRKQVVPQQPAQTVVPAQNTSPAATQTQVPAEKPAGQTTNQNTNTGTAPQSSSPAPQQAASENPSAVNSTANPSTPNSTSDNSASTNAASPNTVRQIQDLTPPKDGGSGQKEFEQARNILKGNHRQRDIQSAVNLLWTGVGKGYVRAEVTLADLYARGDGVPKSCAQARVLLQAAIQKGSPEARRRLDQLKRQGCS